jgi:hypothetical protein
MLYFSCPLGDQDEDLAPHVICMSCSKGLNDWMNRRKMAMLFVIPMIWWEPRNHVDDCYFCCASVTGFSATNKHKIMYTNLNSAMWPIPHDKNLPVPEPPDKRLVFFEQMECEADSSPDAIQHSSDDQNFPEEMTSEPKQFNQQESNNLI